MTFVNIGNRRQALPGKDPSDKNSCHSFPAGIKRWPLDSGELELGRVNLTSCCDFNLIFAIFVMKTAT